MSSRLLLFLIVGILAAPCIESQSASTDGFSTALSALALQLEKGLRKNGENLFVSPLGLVTAMGMTYLGARNSSAQQIYQGLHFSQFANSPADAMANLKTNVELYSPTQPKNYTLNVANQLFLQDGFEILAQFQNDVANYYSAPIQLLDFANAPSSAADTINKWTSDNTEGMIKKIFDKSEIKPSWKLVLANAIYFHGNWEKSFDAKNTKPETFTKLDGSKVQAPLMSLQNIFSYKNFPEINAKVLQMNYIGNDIKMTVILPDEATGLYQLLERLDAEALQIFIGDLPKETVNVKFPKFKFEAEYGEELMRTLKTDLGISVIFNQLEANFSGISTKEQLYVQLVKQKGVVEVDEKGTKAAAVTVVAMGTRSGGSPPRPREFIADHPFMFIISDKRNGAIIFLGTYFTPT